MEEKSTTDQLSELIDSKNRVLTRIHKLVTTQKESINDHKVSELLPLLSAKQSLLDDLNRIERELDPFRSEDPESRQWATEEARAECSAKVDANRLMLNEILAIEQDCEKQLVEQREQTAQKLEGNSTAAEAIKTYQQLDKPSKNRLDLSSEA